jgi:hypothetical protein
LGLPSAHGLHRIKGNGKEEKSEQAERHGGLLLLDQNHGNAGKKKNWDKMIPVNVDGSS